MPASIEEPPYSAGHLYYFREWDFGTGRGGQNKFMLVLIANATSVLHCWPTKTDRSDTQTKVGNGCNNNMSNPFFRFRKGTKVTNQGYQFNFDTNIYLASGLLITPKQILDAHAHDGKVELIGQLRPDILSSLIQCIGACEDVGLKYLRMLGLHP